MSVSIDPSLQALSTSATTRPIGQAVEISAHPLWAESPLHATLFRLAFDLEQDTSMAPPITGFAYAAPFPSSWKRTLTVTDVQYRGFRYPGPIPDPSNGYILLPVNNIVSTEYTGTVDTSTALQPPGGVRIGGPDFVAGGKLSFDGQSPIALTWDPVPSATAYHLDVWRFTAQFTTLAASFDIDGTSLMIPASPFHDGDLLAFILSAEQFPRELPGSLAPNGLPRRTAALGSGRFHLTAHCGDGIVQGGEECDGGGETATCNADCTLSHCGDGIHNATAGEACDNVFDTPGVRRRVHAACATARRAVATVSSTGAPRGGRRSSWFLDDRTSVRLPNSASASSNRRITRAFRASSNASPRFFSAASRS